MSVEVGTQAPDFTLKNQNHEPVTLSSFRGKRNLLLVFYPFAFSGICTGELCQLRDDLSSYEDENVTTLAISADPVFTLKAWSEQQAFKFDLLSDFWPHGQVAVAYGAFNDKAGMANRGTFLIDTTGTVRFAELNEPGQARDQTAWKRAVAALSG
jgi:mycoredoxin-dependent peroxiredoxin